MTGTGDTSDTSADALNLMEKLMNSDVNGMKLYINFIHVRLLSVIIEKKNVHHIIKIGMHYEHSLVLLRSMQVFKIFHIDDTFYYGASLHLYFSIIKYAF